MVLACLGEGETVKTICLERPKRMTILRLEDGYTKSGVDSPFQTVIVLCLLGGFYYVQVMWRCSLSRWF